MSLAHFHRTIAGASNAPFYIDTNEEGHYSLAIGHSQYNPAMYNRGNYSVFSYMSNKENDSEQIMYIYNHTTNKLLDAVSWGTNPSGDYHSNANVLILSDGKILTANETNHNVNVSIKKSDNAYDLSSYTGVATYSSNQPAYFNMVLVGSRIYAIYRSFPDEIYCLYSDDDGSTWSTAIKVADLANANHWAYPRLIFSETKVKFIINRRNSGTYDKAFYLETSDGETFTNKDGSFSKDVSLGVAITAAELAADCEIDTDIGQVIAATEAGSDIFLLTRDTDEIFYSSGASWLSRDISLVDNNITEHRACFHYKGNDEFDLYVNNNNGSIVVSKITTTDAFATFNYETFNNKPNVRTPAIAHNINATNQSIVIVLQRTLYGSGAIEEPDNSYSNFYLHKQL